MSEPQIVSEEDLVEESAPVNLHPIRGEEAQPNSAEPTGETAPQEASSPASEEIHREHRGPDDDGSMQTKYGGPAMIHPGGDFTVTIQKGCPLLVSFDGAYEFFRPGDVLPTDLWEMDEQHQVSLRRGHATCHLSDGRAVVIPTNSPIPKAAVSIREHRPISATLSHEDSSEAKPSEGEAVSSGESDAQST